MRTFKLYSLTLLASLPFVLSACGDDSSSDGAEGGGDRFSTSMSSGAGETGDWGEEGSATDSDGATSGGDGDGDPGGDSTTGDEGEEPEPEPPEPEPEESSEEESESESETGDPLCNDIDDVVLYLSPDDSNSMSSPVQGRERVLAEGGGQLNGVPVRVWEFMNYYGFDYEPAEPGDLNLFAAMQMVEDEESSTFQLQLGVASETMTPEERPPMSVTLVLDTSGSMAGEPMELLKESCRAIASSLKEGDVVSMVEWDTENEWTLAGYAVSGPDDAMLLDRIEDLAAGGGTDLNGGLVSGYELAQLNFDINMLNRIVLVSDGGANAGVTELDLIAENAEFGGSDGIYMVGVGVDKSSNYNDELMNAVTDAGKGASVFLPDESEIWQVFGEDFENTMAIAGRDVQVELTMPPGFEIVKFSGEEFSGDPTEVEPQHIAPNDAMVFYQQVETCAPELIADDAEITVTANWTDPWSFEEKTTSTTWAFGELYNQDNSLLLKGAAVLAYAESLKAFKQAQNNEQKMAALAPAFAAMTAAQQVLPNDADLLEIAMILAQLNP